MLKLLIFTFCLFVSSSFAKSIEVNRLTLVGEGVMSVVFWKVYKAQLYSKNLPFKVDNYPQMLKITYLREIEKSDLLEATNDQWLHIGTSDILRKKWIKSLEHIFPTVQPQDAITLYIDDKKVSHFYLSSANKPLNLIGQVRDPLFGPQFIGIWLSKHTSRPALRRQLLGEK